MGGPRGPSAPGRWPRRALSPRRGRVCTTRRGERSEPAEEEDATLWRRGHASKRSGEANQQGREPGEDSGPSDRPFRDRLPRAGSYLASQASPGSTHRGAGPTSANHVGLVGGAPTNRLGHSDVGPPTRSAWANEERDSFLDGRVSTAL